MTLGDRLSTRDNSLNFVRLVLAAAVIWSHTPPIAYGRGAPMWGERSIGEWAVGGFFAISGYLIANSRSRLQLIDFLWRRAVRIFPGFWVALIVVAFVFAPLSTLATSNPYTLRDGLRYVTSNAALDMRLYTVGTTLVGVPYPAAWNGSCWTLVYEFGAYLVAGLLFTLKPLRTPPFLAAATALLVIGRPLLLPVLSARTADALWLGSFFATGMLAWSLRARLRPSWWWVGICLVELIVAALTSTFLLIGQLPLCYLVLSLGALLPTRLGSTNDISYGVYVYAFPIQQLLAIVGAGAFGYWGFCLVALLLTVPVAALSWYFVEKPSLTFNSLVKRPAHPLGSS